MMNELIKLTLVQEEEIIERGFTTFIEVGQALKRIQVERKYLEFGYSSFNEYMERRWGWSRVHGYHQINASEIGLYLSNCKLKFTPAHETQLRPLSRLRNDDEFDYPRILDAWEEACLLEGPPTAKTVKYVVDEMLYMPPPSLPDGIYNILYADPPWRYDFSMSSTRDIENQYPTMPTEEIARLPIGEISAKDSVLFLWTPSPKLKQGLFVMEEWGFEYKTNMVWIKDKIGMGYYARQQHELLLIGSRGELPQPEPEYRPSSVIEATRLEHSKKPEKTYLLIEQMYPNGKYLELFARQKRFGWTSWGNEI